MMMISYTTTDLATTPRETFKYLLIAKLILKTLEMEILADSRGGIFYGVGGFSVFVEKFFDLMMSGPK